MTTPEPTRWLESVEGPLNAEELAALGAYAQRGPSEAQRTRVWAALDASSAVAPSPSPLRRPVWWWSAGLATLALLAALLVLRSTRPVERAAPVRTSARSAIDPPSVPAAPEVVASPPVAPQPAVRRRPHVRVSASDAAKGADSEPSDPTAELALLTPARQLLATHAARSLELTQEHAQRFPRGVFAEERAFLRIEALLRLSRHAAAELEARNFRRAHPDSTYLERLDLLLRTAAQP